MFDGMTSSEVFKLNRKAGNLHHLLLSPEETFIRDMLLPPAWPFQHKLLFFTALSFIVSGFFWVHWLHPLLAIPGYLLVIPNFLLNLLPGVRTGYKKMILRGLIVKNANARKLNNEEWATACSALREKLQETTWRP